jgi:hypothetical protein
MDAETAAEMEIVVPHSPPEGLHAVVFEQLGVVPEIRGPSRTGWTAVVMFVGAPFFAALLGRLGDAAATRLLAVLTRLSRRPGGADSADPRSDPDELRLVVADGHRVTFVLKRDLLARGPGPDAENDEATRPEAGMMLAEMLRTDVGAYRDDAVLRWSPERRRWVADTDPA